MENIFNNNFDKEFKDNSSLEALEEFFNKEINNLLTPQELIITLLSLSHVITLLSMYNTYSNVAIFDVKGFIAKHPEYANIDFNNLKDLDEDTLEAIDNILHGENGNKGEEFNKGDILIKNIIKIINNIALKLYSSYKEEYNKQTPEDTEQFFTILDNCLENSLILIQSFFTQGKL